MRSKKLNLVFFDGSKISVHLENFVLFVHHGFDMKKIKNKNSLSG